MAGEKIGNVVYLLLSALYGVAVAGCYYSRTYFRYRCYFYYRYYYYYYYDSDVSGSAGVIAGSVIGGLIGLVILIAIIVFVCVAVCKRTSGVRGAVITQATYPVSVVHASHHHYPTTSYPLQPASMHYLPSYQPSAPPQPPPAYSPPPQASGVPSPPVYSENTMGGQPPRYSGYNFNS